MIMPINSARVAQISIAAGFLTLLTLSSSFQSAYAGYVKDGIGKGAKETEGGTKKGVKEGTGGVKKGVKEGTGGVKKGWKETGKLFKKVI